MFERPLTDVMLPGGWEQGFEDEDVKVAEKPREPSQLEGFLGKISQAVNWVPNADK